MKKKVVIYPNRMYYTGTFKDFYSLKDMGLYDDVLELTVIDEETLINDVLEQFG